MRASCRAPIVIPVARHGLRARWSRTGDAGLRVLPRPRPLPAAAPAGLAALPRAGRSFRGARAGARGALRAESRPVAPSGVPCGRPVARLRPARARFRPRTLRYLPGRFPGGVSVQGAPLLSVVPRSAVGGVAPVARLAPARPGGAPPAGGDRVRADIWLGRASVSASLRAAD